MKTGKVYVARTAYDDCSLGDVTFYLPLAELNNGCLCLCTTGNAGSNMSIQTVFADEKKYKSEFINSSGTVIILGEFPLTEKYAEYIYNRFYSMSFSGVKDRIIETLLFLGQDIINPHYREQYISILDLIEKGACESGLKAWSRKFGTNKVKLQEVLSIASEKQREWLINKFSNNCEIEKNTINHEKFRNYLLNLINKEKQNENL